MRLCKKMLRLWIGLLPVTIQLLSKLIILVRARQLLLE